MCFPNGNSTNFAIFWGEISNFFILWNWQKNLDNNDILNRKDVNNNYLIINLFLFPNACLSKCIMNICNTKQDNHNNICKVSCDIFINSVL
jgi:hypothetical protein